MKVSINQDSKNVLLLRQFDAAKRVVNEMKEDESKPADYARYAVSAILSASNDYCTEVIKAEASITRNCRVWNAFNDESEDIDVWVEGIAAGSRCFVRFGAYLSDIWNLNRDNSEAIASAHMFKVIYKEA